METTKIGLEELMSIPDAVTHLHITRASIYRAIERGAIRAVPFAGRQLLLRKDVLDYQPIAYNHRPGRKPVGRKGNQGKEEQG